MLEIPNFDLHCYRDTGVFIRDDNSSKPFKVRADNGKEWWYQENAIETTCEKNEQYGPATPTYGTVPDAHSAFVKGKLGLL